MDQDRTVVFLVGCAVGTGITAFLMTSKSAQKSVKFLRGKAEEGAKIVKDRANDLSDAVTNGVAGGMKTVRYQAENLSAAVEAGKQAYREATEATP
jgi:hypothetical protein